MYQSLMITTQMFGIFMYPTHISDFFGAIIVEVCPSWTSNNQKGALGKRTIRPRDNLCIFLMDSCSIHAGLGNPDFLTSLCDKDGGPGASCPGWYWTLTNSLSGNFTLNLENPLRRIARERMNHGEKPFPHRQKMQVLQVAFCDRPWPGPGPHQNHGVGIPINQKLASHRFGTSSHPLPGSSHRSASWIFFWYSGTQPYQNFTGLLELHSIPIYKLPLKYPWRSDGGSFLGKKTIQVQ